MASYLPDIGARGIFSLKAPFDNLLKPNTSYICQGIRRIEDIISSAEDPFAIFYEPYGLTKDVYEEDLLKKSSIVALQSGMGQWAYVPNTYITMYPDMNGVVYRAIMLGISLGALPDSMSLEAIKTSLTNAVYDLVGVSSIIKEVVVSTPTIISKKDSDMIEAARKSKVKITMSDSAQLSKAKSDLEAARLKITQLESFIKTKLPS